MEQSKGLVMRAQFGGIRERGGKKLRGHEEEKKIEEEELRHHSPQSNRERVMR